MKVIATIEATEADIMWAAGFFEGEGSVRVSRPATRNRGSLLVDVGNCCEELVRFFADRWGGSVSYYGGKGRRREHWRWRAPSLKAAKFLLAIQPHLRSAKYIDRVFHGLAYQAHKSAGRNNRTPEEREAYEQIQWYFYRCMRAMNVRGRDVEAA